MAGYLRPLKIFWANQKSPHYVLFWILAPRVCYCLFQSGELARLLGLIDFGGNVLTELTNKVVNLRKQVVLP